jgi:hypothetical protein
MVFLLSILTCKDSKKFNKDNQTYSVLKKYNFRSTHLYAETPSLTLS